MEREIFLFNSTAAVFYFNAYVIVNGSFRFDGYCVVCTETLLVYPFVVACLLVEESILIVACTARSLACESNFLSDSSCFGGYCRFIDKSFFVNDNGKFIVIFNDGAVSVLNFYAYVIVGNFGELECNRCIGFEALNGSPTVCGSLFVVYGIGIGSFAAFCTCIDCDRVIKINFTFNGDA